MASLPPPVAGGPEWGEGVGRMWNLRVAVLSFSLLLASTLFLPDDALAQRGIAGYTGRGGHVGGHIGIRGRGFVGQGRLGNVSRRSFDLHTRMRHPRAFHHRGFHDHRRFHSPIFRGRFDHFGSFGFPHRRFGSFFGFPDDRFFFGFPHRHFGFFGLPHHHFFFGFPHHHFGFFGPGWFPAGVAVGVPLVFDRVGGDTLRSFGSPYLGPVAGRAADTLPAGEIRPVLDPRVAVAGAGGVGDSLVMERVSVVDQVTRTGLRLTWKDAGQPAEEVTLFLADTTRSVLAVQTVRTPPYTALFEPPPGTAFAGMTVVWQDGSTSTRVVAYRAFGR